MPQPIKPPTLKLRAARPGKEKANWIIYDNRKKISTGCGESERAEAEIKLAEYIARTRRPSFGAGDPHKILVGDCLAFYSDKHGPKVARPDGMAVEIDKLADFFGDKLVSEIRPELCNEYVAWRTAQRDARATKSEGRHIKPSTARRELVTLAAALNWCFKNKKLDRPTFVHLPQVPERRERYLKRREVAVLLWAALGFDKDGRRNQFRVNRHLARFILVGLYTGTRHDAILSLQWSPNTTGGWFDLDAGILYRRPQDAVETNKRRTPCPIPPRLMPHLRRWRAHSTQYVVEYDGKPITSQMRRAWRGARKLAGFGPDVTPHILKHTCATLMLQRGISTWRVAKLLGTSEAVIERTYGHHAMDDLTAALNVWSERPK